MNKMKKAFIFSLKFLLKVIEYECEFWIGRKIFYCYLRLFFGFLFESNSRKSVSVRYKV